MAYGSVNVPGVSMPELKKMMAAHNTAPDSHADIRQRLSNPNLLDNWYFADPINQRGQAEYTGAGYALDRWQIVQSDPDSIISLKLDSGGVKISYAGKAAWVLTQKLENNRCEKGTYTLSLLVLEITGTAATLGLREPGGTQPVVNITEPGLYSVSVDFTSAASSVQPTAIISSKDNSDFTMKVAAMKLEQGAVQTLAHKEGDTWVLNDPPPDKTLELMKCQRYQRVVTARVNRPVWPVVFTTNTEMQFGQPISPPLRITSLSSTILEPVTVLIRSSGRGTCTRTLDKIDVYLDENKEFVQFSCSLTDPISSDGLDVTSPCFAYMTTGKFVIDANL